MREFYYTSCPTGKRADDTRPTVGGYGIRAWTSGSTKAQFESILRLAGCDFPPGENTRRLAFFRRDGQSVLLHSAPGGSDEVGRGGVPFTHAIAELPAEFDPVAAIRTWGSPDWQTSYPTDADTTLEGEPTIPVNGPLNDTGLAKFLADTKNRELARYVLAATMSPTPPAKTFVYAPAESVAWVVYAVLRAAPAAVRSEFTFSTYEKGLLDYPGRLIGNWGDTRDNDLPRTCYQSNNAAMNVTTGRTSTPFSSVYADLAIQWLATGYPNRVEQFQSWAESLGVTSGVALGDLAILKHDPEQLTPDVITRLLSDPRAAAEVTKSTPALEAVLRWVTDPATTQTQLLSAFLHSAGPGPTHERVSQYLEDTAINACEDKTPTRLTHLLSLLKQCDATREGKFGETAVGRLNPTQVAWTVKKVLLPRIRDAFRQEATSPSVRVAGWIRVEQNQLNELFALALPAAWEILAVAEVARNEPVRDPTVVKWLSSRPERVRDVYRSIGVHADPASLATAMDQTATRPLFIAFDSDGGPVPTQVVDRVLADRSLTRELLSRPAIQARLISDSGALERFVRENVEDTNTTVLLGREFLAAVGEKAVAALAAEIGWESLRAGKMPQAQCVFETLLPKLGKQTPLLDRTATISITDYRPEAQRYLLNFLLARGPTEQRQIIAWLPQLSVSHLGGLLSEQRASDELKLTALQTYFTREGRIPAELENPRLPLPFVMQGLKWLIGQPSRGPAAAQVVVLAQIRDTTREGELHAQLFQSAQSDPVFWPLADYYFGDWMSRNPTRAVDSIDLMGLPVLKGHGLTDNVRRLIDLLLSQSKPFDRGTSTERFFKTVHEVADWGTGRGSLNPDTLTYIHYLLERLKEPAKGADMFEWLKQLIGISGADPRQQQLQRKDVALRLGRELIALPANADATDWLDKALTKFGTTKPFTSRGDLLQTMFAELKEAGVLDLLWKSTPAVLACLMVCLGLRGSTSSGRDARGVLTRTSTDSTLDKLFGWLCESLYFQEQEFAFFRVYRYTANWPEIAVSQLRDGYKQAKQGRPGTVSSGSTNADATDTAQAQKPGFWGRLLGG